MPALRIERVESGAGATSAEAYVRARTSVVHELAGWQRALQQAYGIGSTSLQAVDSVGVQGTLTLDEIRHPLFGNYLTTAAFGTDGGLLYDTLEARDALLQAALEFARQGQVDYLLIRTRHAPLPAFQVDSRYQTAQLELEGGAEACWNRLPGKARNQVRRGRKEGFSLSRGPDQMRAFFDVFHQHMRDLGTPGHRLEFYRAILEHLGEHAEFYVVRDGSDLVAGALLFRVNGTAMNLHTVSLRAYNRRCPNYLLYWTMIEDSCNSGCRWFDMGRSELGSPQLDFKRNWAPDLVPLFYNYFLVRSKEIPRLDPRNPKFRLAIACWQRMPLALTRFLGPRLISGLA